jgi:hypothetical protein
MRHLDSIAPRSHTPGHSSASERRLGMGRQRSSVRRQRAIAEMLDALATYLDLVLLVEEAQIDPFARPHAGRSCVHGEGLRIC